MRPSPQKQEKDDLGSPLGFSTGRVRVSPSRYPMLLFITIAAAAGFLMTAFAFWKRFAGGEWAGPEGRLFLRWVITGAIGPCLVWFLLNTGWIGPPVWPLVTPLSAGLGAWWASFIDPLTAGIFLITSSWGGLTAFWLLARGYDQTEDRRAFQVICGAWSFLLVPGMALVLLAGGWGAIGLALMLGGFTLFHATRGLVEVKQLPPSYARAQARLSFGKYEEAEMEVIQELERCETDFEGWLMLADLYATHFDDLAGADQTLRGICDEPFITPVQFSIAMHKLADWHLKLGHDPVAAGEALERIGRRAPGTHLEKMARQRLDQLPATREELLARERGKPLPLPHLPDIVTPPGPRLPRDQARVLADACVKELEHNPDDVMAREKFARLLAESLEAPGPAIEQLELLLAQGHQPPAKRAEWLIVMAGWHARLRDDTDTARLVFQEVLRDFPGSPHAAEAQRRISLLNLQARFRRPSTARATV